MTEPMKVEEVYVFKDEAAIEGFKKAHWQNELMVDTLRGGFVVVEEEGYLDAYSIDDHSVELKYADGEDVNTISIAPEEREFFVLRDKEGQSNALEKFDEAVALFRKYRSGSVSAEIETALGIIRFAISTK